MRTHDGILRLSYAHPVDDARDETGGNGSRSLFGRVAGSVTGRFVDAVDDVVLDNVDVDALLEHIDVDRLIERIDVNALLDRVDTTRLLDRVDVDRLLDQVDVDRLLARVDVEAFLSTVDLEAIVRRSGVPEIVAESTGRVAGSALDAARRQLVGLDVLVDRVVDRVVDQIFTRILRRAPMPRRNGPPLLEVDGPVETDGPRRNVTGHYAGTLSRAAALALDLTAIITSYTIGYAGLDKLTELLLNRQLSGDYAAPVAGTLLVLWGFFYVFGSLAIAGRTLGKTVVGLRVTDRTGRTLGIGQAAVRTLALPISGFTLGAGFLLAVVQRDNRALHDLIGRTSVVYDWGERSVQLPGPLSDFIARSEARLGGSGSTPSDPPS